MATIRGANSSRPSSPPRWGGQRVTDVRMIRGRTHTTIWSEMAKNDDETAHAILHFVTRLARADSR